jgi:hypothetical protein
LQVQRREPKVADQSQTPQIKREWSPRVECLLPGPKANSCYVTIVQ